jgi:hypothetical protein
MPLRATPSNNGIPNLVSVPKGHAPLNSAGMQLANLAAWHLIRIGNTGVLSAPPEPASSQAIGSIPNPAATQKRVWLDEPPGSVPFDYQKALAVPPSAGFGIIVPVVQFTVPIGLDGIIRWISNNVVNGSEPFVPGALVWSILINGRAVPNFEMIMNEKGTVAQGRVISPIRIFAGDVVSYTVQAMAGTTLTGQTVCSLTGYYFPAKGIS